MQVLSKEDKKNDHLEESLNIRQKALELSMSGIVFADLPGKVIYANKAFFEMWGYTDNREVLGMPVALFWQDEKLAWRVFRTVQEKGSWSGKMTGKGADGLPFDVLVSSSLYSAEDGEPLCFIGSFMRIEEWARNPGLKQYFSLTDGCADKIAATLSSLTPRESEVMRLTAQGLSSTAIAERLSISHRTVENHRYNLMQKLSLHNRAELIRYAFRNNLMA